MIRGLVRLLLFPIRLILAALILVLSILVGVGKAVLYLLMGLCILVALGFFFVGSSVMGVQLLIVAFLFSPLGIPLIGTVILGFVKGIYRVVNYI